MFRGTADGWMNCPEVVKWSLPVVLVPSAMEVMPPPVFTRADLPALIAVSRPNTADAPLLAPSMLRSWARRPHAALSPCSAPAVLLPASYLVWAASRLLTSL